MSETNSSQESLNGFRETNIRMARYILKRPDLIEGGSIRHDPLYMTMDATAEDYARQLIGSRDTTEMPTVK